jgi:hypothetical protein
MPHASLLPSVASLLAITALGGCATGSTASFTQSPIFFSEEYAADGEAIDTTDQVRHEAARLAGGSFTTAIPGYLTIGGNAALPVGLPQSGAARATASLDLGDGAPVAAGVAVGASAASVAAGASLGLAGPVTAGAAVGGPAPVGADVSLGVSAAPPAANLGVGLAGPVGASVAVSAPAPAAGASIAVPAVPLGVDINAGLRGGGSPSNLAIAPTAGVTITSPASSALPASALSPGSAIATAGNILGGSPAAITPVQAAQVPLVDAASNTLREARRSLCVLRAC